MDKRSDLKSISLDVLFFLHWTNPFIEIILGPVEVSQIIIVFFRDFGVFRG
jgi:hypothetical protein